MLDYRQFFRKIQMDWSYWRVGYFILNSEDIRGVLLTRYHGFVIDRYG